MKVEDVLERARQQAEGYERRINNQKASINRLLTRIEELEQKVRNLGGTP